MPLILPARTLDSGYEISNSLRFNDGDSPSLGRIPSSASNKRTWTWSAWVKISTGTAHDHTFFSGGTGLGASGNRVVFCILSGESEKVMVFSGNTSQFALKTSASLRDKSAFYHFVLAMDTTQSTESNRFKMYINGSQVTDTAQLTYPSQNLELGVNTDQQHYIGFRSASNDTPFDGYMADVNFADGTQYAASDFGEYNDNGVWIPKEPNITYGTNGYRLEFKNSGALGTDTSGNGNNFTPTNLTATDQTTDTPTNNFCTLNPLDNYFQAATFAEGNTKITTNASNYSASSSTIGVANGKWYFEAKATDVHDSLIGVSGQTETSSSNGLGQNANQVGYLSSGNARKGGSDTSTGYNSYTDGDIIGVALDVDNSKIYFSKNGTYQASGDPANNSNGFALTDVASTSTGFYTPSVGDNGSSAAIWEMNFGNAPFSISSGNADANGYGNFEYAVPSGYYALCTKNLAEYG